MKRPRLKIIGIEEGEETQVKDTENVFNKITEKYFPNLKKEMPIKAQDIQHIKWTGPEEKVLLAHNKTLNT